MMISAIVGYRLIGRELVTESTPRPPVRLDTSRWCDGDVILRKGRGVISDVLRYCSLHDRTFSHAGLLFRVGNRWQVFHILGGEGAVNDGVSWEPINQFCSVDQADTVAVFRLTDDASVRDSLLTVCRAITLRHPSFDTRFDLATNDQLYCTELVALVYRQASRGKISLPLTDFSGQRYVSCENLYHNSYAHSLQNPSSNE